MEILLMLLEDTEKIVTGECQIVVLYFLLTAVSERWKYSMEYDGMLVVHIVHVIYGWKSRSLEVAEREPTISTGWLAAHTRIYYASVHSTL